MSQVKDVFRNAQAIILIIVILVFGWMYFLHDRVFADTKPPRAEINHEIYSACLNDEYRWIRAIVELRNVGPVPLALSESDHYVAQVSPVSRAFRNVLQDRESKGVKRDSIDWPVLSHIHYPPDASGRVLEPSDRYRMYHDFMITPNARIVEVTSSFANASSGDTGTSEDWEAKTIYSIGDATCVQ